MNKPDAIVKYSEYIRNYLKENKPKDWNVSLWGEFPATSNRLQKYFKYILEHKPSRDKVKALEKHYNFNSKDTIDKKMLEIGDKTRSIANFLKNKIDNPREKNLNFIAYIFDVPICSFNDFVENYTIQEEIKPEIKEKVEEEIKEEVEETIKGEEVEEEIKEEEKVKINDNVLENSITENDVAATPTSTNAAPQQNTEVDEKTRSFKKHLFISMFLMSVIFIFYIGFYNSIAQNNNDNKSAHRSVMPHYIGDTLFELITTVDNNQQDTGLRFRTVNIFNDSCLYKNGPWSFTTDPKGEDMNSEYGIPYNEEITPKYPILRGRTTIANRKMEIHFSITNNTNKNLYFANFMVSVLRTYDAKVEKAEYNLYQSRAAEQLLTINLCDENTYRFAVKKQEVKPNKAIFCKCEITGDDRCQGLIYRIKMVADFVDANGKHDTIRSDKDYFIGFVY